MNSSLETSQSSSLAVGSVVELGQHRLFVGDCRDAASVAQFLQGEQIDLLLTDPPYGIAYVEGKAEFTGSKSHRPIANDGEQSEAHYRRFTRDWLFAAKPYYGKKNAAYIFHADRMLFALRGGMEDAGWKFGQMLIWLKTAAVVGRLDYLPQHELVAYGWCGTHLFRRSKDKSLLIHPRPSKSKLHPTMKPVGLLRRLILNSTEAGATVYDPFGGSGSTLIACEQTKRRCLMVEIDPKYGEVIMKRYEKLTGTAPVIRSVSSYAH